jgi:hypothetical protein
VQDDKQLQAFLKGWAQLHLPAKLAQLRALAGQVQQQDQEQQQEQQAAGALEGAAPAAATQAAQAAGAADDARAGDAGAGAPGGNAVRVPSTGTLLQATIPAAAEPTSQEEAVGTAGARQLLPGGGGLPGAGQKRRRISPRDPRTAPATVTGLYGAAAAEPGVMNLVGNEQAAVVQAAHEAAPEAGPAAAPVHGPAPGAASNPLTSLASLQLPPLSSFAGDSGRPLKRRMLSKLQPLLVVAGASAKHVSGQGHAHAWQHACAQ